MTDSEGQHPDSWTAPVQLDVNKDLLIPAGFGSNVLHPVLLLYILFVPLNYSYTIMNTHNSPGTQSFLSPFYNLLCFSIFPFNLIFFPALSVSVLWNPWGIVSNGSVCQAILVWHGWSGFRIQWCVLSKWLKLTNSACPQWGHSHKWELKHNTVVCYIWAVTLQDLTTLYNISQCDINIIVLHSHHTLKFLNFDILSTVMCIMNQII